MSMIRQRTSFNTRSAPRSKGKGSSWVCETLDSRVFSTTPAPQRQWVTSNSAGAARERVSSKGRADAHFFEHAPPRADYPNEPARLMSSILYGHDGHVSDRRTRGPVVNVYSNAAGQPTAREPHVADRHPNLPTAIKADASRPYAGSEVATVVFNQPGATTPESDAAYYRRLYGRASSNAQQREREGTAQEVLYPGAPSAAWKAAADAAAFSESVTPRKLRGHGGPQITTTGGDLQGYIFPEGGVLAPPSGNETRPQSVPLAIGGREHGWQAEPFYTGKRTFSQKKLMDLGPGGVAAALSEWVADPAAAAAASIYLVKDHANQAVRQLKRGIGTFHPTKGHQSYPAISGLNMVGTGAVAQDPALLVDMLHAVAAAPQGEIVPDAGVQSDRLHALRNTAGAVTTGAAYVSERSPLARRVQGTREGRAGTGAGPKTLEIPIGLGSRRIVDAVAIGSLTTRQGRNPILGESSLISPTKSRLERCGRGRWHAFEHEQVAIHGHLDSTFIPDAAGSPSKGVGKATARPGYDELSRGTFTLAHEHRAAEAPAALMRAPASRDGPAPAGLRPERLLKRSLSWSGDAPGCGRRSLPPPTHEPHPFDLAHRTHEPSKPLAAPSPLPPSQQPPPPTPSSTHDGHPAHSLADSLRARAQATDDYTKVRLRGTNSTIFSNLHYPDAP